jgi:dihydroorotase
MKKLLIKDAKIVNEGTIFEGDILIEGSFIKEIAKKISPKTPDTNILYADGQFLFPGMIDDQVHFREPGLTHKGDIASESRAAVAGGITSFIEMPNTQPQATTQKELEKKFSIAAKNAYANYSFMFGGTNDNLKELLKTDPQKVAGIKLFLGSSTGNMLVDDEQVLEKIFSSTNLLIAAHCEDEKTIQDNLKKYIDTFGEDIPVALHPQIRSSEACYISSSGAVALAKKTGARLHVFHVSTAQEMDLFTNDIPLSEKKITAEVCVHHLWFNDSDYDDKGTLIKWNPAIKSEKHQKALWKALLDDRIDVIATDHAPHTLEEKRQVYTKSPSGAPMVQHALPALIEFYKKEKISLEKIVQKTAHNPAILFNIKNRGFIREGYYADLVLIDLSKPWTVKKDNILYKCGWSPMEGNTFTSRITHTFVNGNLVYKNGIFNDKVKGMRLEFNRKDL